jgi:hypothetical protein
MKTKNPFKANKWEICFKLINSFLAGALVFIGAFTDGTITNAGLTASVGASIVAFITQFKDYWSSQESEYKRKFFDFIP